MSHPINTDTADREASAREREIDQLIGERDSNEAMADRLAEVLAEITGTDIGEHSSENNPWRNALDAGEAFIVGQTRARAEAEAASSPPFEALRWAR